MRRIEIMGASGVGKTTLYNKLSQLPINNRSFISQKEAYIIAAKNCNVSIRQWELFLYKYAIISGFFKKKHLGISRVLLSRLYKKYPVNDNRYNEFIISFNILYELLKEEKRPDHVYNRIVNFLDRVNEYIILDYFFPGDEIVMIDEGMLKYHPGITDYGIKTYSINSIQNDLAFRPVAIIYCNQSADIVFNQAKWRRDSGVVTASHGSLNNDELMEYVHNNIVRQNRKIERYEKIGIPVLHINTGNEINDINFIINKFISDL